MKQYTRVLARVNLDAVEYNIEMMKKNYHKNYPADGSHQNGWIMGTGLSRLQNFWSRWITSGDMPLPHWTRRY